MKKIVKTLIDFFFFLIKIFFKWIINHYSKSICNHFSKINYTCKYLHGKSAMKRLLMGTQLMNNFVKWDKENLHKVDCEMPTLYSGFYLFIVRIYSFNSNILFSVSLRMRFTKIK